MESFFCGKRRGGVTGFMFLWLAAGAMAVGQSGPTESPPGQAAPGTAVPGPQLELSITGPQKAAVGDRVTFELVVTNVGKSPAAKLLAIDDFDNGRQAVPITLQKRVPVKSFVVTERQLGLGHLWSTLESTV